MKGLLLAVKQSIRCSTLTVGYVSIVTIGERRLQSNENSRE
jgi:hypothetical protein